ncbi:MAG: polysaccharide deacetylase family protein [Armatimonadetes bacterium]|nr:polysaccharide deacetylase family protein [Armatimonadota bacterium]
MKGPRLPLWRVPILMYHRVSATEPSPADYFFTLSRRRFAQQMHSLHREGFTVIPLDQVLDWLEHGCRLPRRPVAITFDDGYAETYRLAVPVLERFGFPATFFLVSDHLGGRTSWESSTRDAGHRVLGWEEARSLVRRGFTVGSHTRSHPVLPQLDDARLYEELAGSRQVLEARLGVPVRLLAYPRNRCDARCQAAARDAGYRGACAGDGQAYHPFCLDRVDVTHASPRLFRAKLSPWFHAFRRLRFRILGPLGHR